MSWSIRIARISGVDVKIHLTFLILPLLAGLSAYAATGGNWFAVAEGVGSLLLLFGCVLLHEFGHALAARHYGIRTADITLLPIGGIARLERMPEDPWQEIVVALAGPAVNVAIILGLALALGPGNVISAVRTPLDEAAESTSFFLLSINVKLQLFNLIPAFPMDGGRVLRALLALRFGHARATQAAASVGQIFAVCFGLAGLGLLIPGLPWNPLLIILAFFHYAAGSQEATAAHIRHVARTVRLSQAMITDFRTLSANATLADAVELLIHTSQHDFPVLDSDGHVAGVLTRRDLITGLGSTGPSTPAANVMQRDVPSIFAHASFEDAFLAMQSSGSPALPVVDRAGRLVGLITPDNVGEMMMVQSFIAREERRPAAWRELPESGVRPV